jgi:Transcriptional regulator C-terminal region
MTPGEAAHGPVRPVGVMFEHAHRHGRIYRAGLGRSGDSVLSRHLHDVLAELLGAHLAAIGTRMPVEVVAEYHASALLGLLVWWVRQDFPYGPEEMSRMCQDLTAPGVRGALDPAVVHGPHLP